MDDSVIIDLSHTHFARCGTSSEDILLTIDVCYEPFFIQTKKKMNIYNTKTNGQSFNNVYKTRIECKVRVYNHLFTNQ